MTRPLPGRRARPAFCCVLLSILACATDGHAADAPARPATGNERLKKVVLIAGPKSHGPVGNGVHDYGWSVRLLRAMLERSSVKGRMKIETHLDGWPADPKAVEDADTVVVISDGRDGDQYREAEHLASPERVAEVDRLMKRGCGIVTIHFSNFAPDKYADQVLDWTGGFFDWEADGKRQWYSAITTLDDAEVKVAAPPHPVARGVRPSFRMKEEFYYNLRFNPAAGAVTPLLTVPELKGRAPDGRTVAWARERGAGGGRGFGTTCGHFYDNWRNDDFRTLVLNAVAWTAHVDVPEAGVGSTFLTHEQIEAGERQNR